MSDHTETNLQVAECIARMLVERGVPVVVIGAVALAAHGYVRFKEDIDLGVNADMAQMRALVEQLRKEGYEAEFHAPEGDDPLAGVINVSGPFGLVQVISFEERFPAVIRDALEGEEIRMRPDSAVPIPQLVALKLYAGGWSSHADIIELLRRNPGVDKELIRSTCRKYRLRGIGRILEELEAG